MASQDDDPFTVDGPINAVGRLAYLNISTVENAPIGSTFHVRGFAAFGAATVHSEDGDGFRIGVRQVIVEPMVNNCQLVPGTIREEIIQDGTLALESSVKTSAHTQAKIGVSLRGAISAVGADGMLTSNAGYSKEVSGQKTSKAEIQQRISRVEFVAGGWRFGAESGGDPIKGFGDLDGKYLDGVSPWAALQFNPQQNKATVMFEMWLPHGMLTVAPTSDTARNWWKFSHSEKDEKTKALQALKSIVAGMVISSSLPSTHQSSGGYDRRSGEVLLGYAKITARNPGNASDAEKLAAKDEVKLLPPPSANLENLVSGKVRRRRDKTPKGKQKGDDPSTIV